VLAPAIADTVKTVAPRLLPVYARWARELHFASAARARAAAAAGLGSRPAAASAAADAEAAVEEPPSVLVGLPGGAGWPRAAFPPLQHLSDRAPGAALADSWERFLPATAVSVLVNAHTNIAQAAAAAGDYDDAETHYTLACLLSAWTQPQTHGRGLAPVLGPGASIAAAAAAASAASTAAGVPAGLGALDAMWVQATASAMGAGSGGDSLGGAGAGKGRGSLAGDPTDNAAGAGNGIVESGADSVDSMAAGEEPVLMRVLRSAAAELAAPVYPHSQADANALVMKASLLGQLGALAHQQFHLEKKIKTLLAANDGRTLPPPAALGHKAAYYAHFVHPGTVANGKASRGSGTGATATMAAAAAGGGGLDVAVLADALCGGSDRLNSQVKSAAGGSSSVSSGSGSSAAPSFKTSRSPAVRAANLVSLDARIRAVNARAVAAFAGALTAVQAASALWPPARAGPLGDLLHLAMDLKKPRLSPTVFLALDSAAARERVLTLGGNLAQALTDAAAPEAVGMIDSLIDATVLHLHAGQLPALYAGARRVRSGVVGKSGHVSEITLTQAAAVALPRTPALAELFQKKAVAAQVSGQSDVAEKALFQAMWHACAAPAAAPATEAGTENEEVNGALAFATLAPHPTVPVRVVNAIVLQYASLLSRRGDHASAAMIMTHLVVDRSSGADPEYVKQVLASG
jgi:hypothetical protein